MKSQVQFLCLNVNGDVNVSWPLPRKGLHEEKASRPDLSFRFPFQRGEAGCACHGREKRRILGILENGAKTPKEIVCERLSRSSNKGYMNSFSDHGRLSLHVDTDAISYRRGRQLQ